MLDCFLEAFWNPYIQVHSGVWKNSVSHGLRTEVPIDFLPRRGVLLTPNSNWLSRSGKWTTGAVFRMHPFSPGGTQTQRAEEIEPGEDFPVVSAFPGLRLQSCLQEPSQQHWISDQIIENLEAFSELCLPQQWKAPQMNNVLKIHPHPKRKVSWKF